MDKIELHNTLSGKKEAFAPLSKTIFGRPKVGMYHCGPTVYDYIHIGNLRSFLLADTLRRMFEAHGYKVSQVMNITDVGLLEGDNDEDKMTIALKREGKPLTLEAMSELATFYARAFESDLEALNIKRPKRLPRASEHIKEDIELVKKLEKKGLTYKITDGIYFDTTKTSDYGKLGQLPDVSNEKSRIGMNAEKKNARDFALWKFNSDLGWPSPWGRGFPGWHIECSAMSMRYLGETFDIHTGGIDLIPIHHNNEIAQSESATGRTFARYWLHNAFVNVGEAKMAKSAGNFITLKSLGEKGFSPIEYRYFLLGARYSTPLNFSWQSLEAASTGHRRLVAALNELPQGGKANEDLWQKALGFISDDLDTPKALALVWDIVRSDSLSPADKRATIMKIDELLGLMPKTVFAKASIPQDVKKLMAERMEARTRKDWKKSDELRQKIASLGYEVKDTPQGQVVDKK